MKIVLILPHDSTYRHKSGTFNKTLRYPPITLTILAGLVPPDVEADVRIIDEGVDPLPENLEADLVGISAVTATALRAYFLADMLRKKGITVVLGGVHPTVLPDEAIQHANAVVIGFAEESWPKLLRDFKNGNLQKFYNPPARTNLAHLPLPRRDLLTKDSYLTVNTIMATWGCPNRCKYCSIPIARQGQYYQRPVEDVVREIKSMKGRRYIFLDPNPNEDVDYATRLYEALIPLNIKWVGLTTTKIMNNEKLLDLAVKSGCFGLLLGFETISQEALCQSHKDFNSVHEYNDMVRRLHCKNISVLGCFMFGFDSDDGTSFEKTFEFIKKAEIDLLRYTIFTPFPGTRVYDDFKKQGRIIEDNWELYDYEHVVFKPAQMTPEALQKGVEWIWKETYSIKSIARRMSRTKLSRWENIIYNFGFRHHARKLNNAHRVCKSHIYENI